MNKKIIFILTLLVLVPLLYAMQPPCSDQELVKTSSYAVKGKIISKTCGTPFVTSESQDCKQYSVNCTYKLKITYVIKGDYKEGQTITFQRVIYDKSEGACQEGAGPSSFNKNLSVGDYIMYYPNATHFQENFGGIECPNEIQKYGGDESDSPENKLPTFNKSTSEKPNTSKEIQKATYNQTPSKNPPTKKNYTLTIILVLVVLILVVLLGKRLLKKKY